MRLVKALQPKMLIHGHVHPYGRNEPQRSLGNTQIINAVPSKIFEI